MVEFNIIIGGDNDRTQLDVTELGRAETEHQQIYRDILALFIRNGVAAASRALSESGMTRDRAVCEADEATRAILEGEGAPAADSRLLYAAAAAEANMPADSATAFVDATGGRKPAVGDRFTVAGRALKIARVFEFAPPRQLPGGCIATHALRLEEAE